MKIKNEQRVERAFLSDDPGSRRYVVLDVNTADRDGLGCAELYIYDGTESISFNSYPMLDVESLNHLHEQQGEIETLIEYLKKYKIHLTTAAELLRKRLK
jgi:hypothetical protein